MIERPPRLSKAEPLYKKSVSDLTEQALKIVVPEKSSDYAIFVTDLQSYQEGGLLHDQPIGKSLRALHLTKEERSRTAIELWKIRKEKRASERGAWASYIKNKVGKDGLNADGSIKEEVHRELFHNGYYDQNPNLVKLIKKRGNRVSSKSSLLQKRNEIDEENDESLPKTYTTEVVTQEDSTEQWSTRDQKVMLGVISSLLATFMYVDASSHSNNEYVKQAQQKAVEMAENSVYTLSKLPNLNYQTIAALITAIFVVHFGKEIASRRSHVPTTQLQEAVSSGD